MTQLDRWIGSNVERLRKRRELNQVDVAERMSDDGFKWSQRTVWAVEKGERPLRLAEAQVLARGFKVGLDELVGAPEAMAVAHKFFDANDMCRHAVSNLGNALQQAQAAMNIAQFELMELSERQTDVNDVAQKLPDATMGKFLYSYNQAQHYAQGGLNAFFNDAMELLPNTEIVYTDDAEDPPHA